MIKTQQITGFSEDLMHMENYHTFFAVSTHNWKIVDIQFPS